MDKSKLSDREAALVEAARRELAAGASVGPGPRPEPGRVSLSGTPIGSPAPSPVTTGDPNPATMMQQPSVPSPRPDAGARIAALMQTEQEEKVRRKKRLRQFGIVIPALVLIAATLWVVIAIFRYARM